MSETLNTEGHIWLHSASNTIVMYFRLVTVRERAFKTPVSKHSSCLYAQASQIQAHVDEFEFFLFHPDTREPMSVPDFCNRVMGLGKEAGKSSEALVIIGNQP
jgi:hypothetical protein